MQKSVDITDKVLTEAQNAAIYSIDRPMAVVAGAGSGKTTVLINRCRHIIGDDWKEIDRLLAITFTEKAAGELKARLRPYVPTRDQHRIEGAWIGTFHAFCARMLRQHAPVVGLDPDFHILDENASRLVTGQTIKNTLLTMLKDNDEHASFLVDAVDFRTAVGALEDLSAFRWHAKHALSNEAIADAEDEKILFATSKVFSEVEKNIAIHLSRLGALDFQDLEIRAIDLINRHPDILASYQKKFRHILVDEFQDTNDAQTDLILKLFEPKTNQLCIVGDPRQSIYRFRGANIDCFTNVLENIKTVSGESIDLAENFRSKAGIIKFVNSCQKPLSDGLFGSLAIKDITVERENMIATRPDDGVLPAVMTIPVATDEKPSASIRRELEAKAITNYISHLISDKLAEYGDIVCLFQALTSISPYERAFRIANIPYLIFGGRGLLNRQEISDLFSVLCYAADPTDNMAMLGILRSPLIGLSDDDLAMLAGESGESLIENARMDERCELLNEISSMADHLRPSEILRKTISLTGYEIICRNLDNSGGMTANVDRFISLAASIERQEPTPLRGFTEFVKELKQRSARIGDPPAAGDTSNAIRCMTVHAAKGLEFPIVILPDLFRKMKVTGGKWQFTRERGIAFKMKTSSQPLGKREETERYKELHKHDSDSQIAESKRLLYVAMTRAMNHLVLPTHQNIKGEGHWYSWLEPVIQDGLKAGSIGTWNPSNYKDTTADALTPKTPEGDTRMWTKSTKRTGVIEDTLTVSHLECYYRCPQEYYLKYVLGVPANEFYKQNSERLPANIFGSVVHSILECYNPDNKIDLETVVRSACLKNNVFPNTDIIDDAKRVISQFNDNPLSNSLSDGEREVRFDWIFNGLTITGYIDWLKESGDTLEIIDFKTDHIAEEEIEERAREYELQMLCYALAAETARGRRAKSATLAFLIPGKNHVIEFDKTKIDDSKKLMVDIIKAIREKNFDISKVTPPCYKCPYRHNNTCWKATSV
ncbi:MAG: ATP-dependent helicase [Deltaproteobacteria bacterium]|nr:ATP-dependent helicase [Deltaproteobacteria bacterium]